MRKKLVLQLLGIIFLHFMLMSCRPSMSDSILKRLYTSENMRESLYAQDLIVYGNPKDKIRPKYIIFQPYSNTFTAIYPSVLLLNYIIVGSCLYNGPSDTIICYPQLAIQTDPDSDYRHLEYDELDSIDSEIDSEFAVPLRFLKKEEQLIPLTRSRYFKQPDAYLRIR